MPTRNSKNNNISTLLFVIIYLLCNVTPLVTMLSQSSSTTNINNHQQQSSSLLLEKSCNIPIFFDSSNHLHSDIRYHAEQPARIQSCIDAIKEYIINKKQKIKEKQQEENEVISSSIIDIIDVSPDNNNNDDDDDGNNNNNDNDDNDDNDDYDDCKSKVITKHEPFTQKELQHARKMLVKAHSEEYVQRIESCCCYDTDDSPSRRHHHPKKHTEDDKKDNNTSRFIGYVDNCNDTYISTETYDVCLRATAAWIRAVDYVMITSSSTTSSNSNKLPAKVATTTAAAAMALTRPPGHHATSTLSNGFCIFNFCAAAAIHAISTYSSNDVTTTTTSGSGSSGSGGDCCFKVSILDWDVHYGQGTADIVKNYPNSIRYASIHQTPAFPYMGEKRSILQPSGNVLTVPIRPETTWTCGYHDALVNHALPFLFDTTTTPTTTTTATNGKDVDGANNGGNGLEVASAWVPDLVIVSAGYDALDSDELASVNLQAKDYCRITRCLTKHMGWSTMTPVEVEEEKSDKRNTDITTRANTATVPALVLGLEGGYQLSKMAGGGNLQNAIVETIDTLLSSHENKDM